MSDVRKNGLIGDLTSRTQKSNQSIPYPSGLLNAFLRPEVKNLYYRNQTVTLDGYTFIGCRFDNCVLQVSSTNFNLLHCVIDSETSIVYGAAVMKIIRLFASRYSWSNQFFPGFVPIQNSDGTITITDEPI